jgi:hypothetical protein
MVFAETACAVSHEPLGTSADAVDAEATANPAEVRRVKGDKPWIMRWIMEISLTVLTGPRSNPRSTQGGCAEINP